MTPSAIPVSSKRPAAGGPPGPPVQGHGNCMTENPAGGVDRTQSPP